jgi:predicted DNA binding CopG/RHH family protein
MAQRPNKKPGSRIPEFKTETEEADWYATPEGRRHTRREFEKALRDGTVRYAPGEKVQRTDPAILQQLMEQAKAKATRLIAIRVPVVDLERAHTIAEQRGVGYQAVLKEAIREGLNKAG